MISYSRLRKAAAWGVAAAAALGLATIALAPAGAESVVQRLVALTCNDPKPCISVTNTSPKGHAIVGVAQDNAGIFGRININTSKCFAQTCLPANGGVWGVDASTNQLDTNAGVLGTSANGSGVAGITSVDSSVSQFGQAGVEGYDILNKVGGFNVGVYGQSNYSGAVLGLALNPPGVGVLGEGLHGALGVFGGSENDTVSSPGVGVAGRATYGIGVFAGSAGTGENPALFVANYGGGDPIQAYTGNGGPTGTINIVMRLDKAGDLNIAGNLQTGVTPMAVNATSLGRKVLTYAAQQSTRTVEDIGEAQLVHGQAAVSLERTFASAIDARRPYLVFITPQGDSNGLYVAQKSASGFVVREHNGASNIAFDYRIVAQPYGSLAQRLPPYATPNVAPGAAERYTMNRLLSLKRVHRPRYQQR